MRKIIVGLGNPGNEYKFTRHNAGFLFIDRLAWYLEEIEKQNISFKQKYNAEFAAVKFKNYDILLVKPMTYMNNSGHSLAEFVKFYKVALDDIYVFYDDVDIEPAKVKYKLGGGSGGHNGIKSLDSHIGQNYHRIRIGVGKDAVARTDSHVLSNFKEEELDNMITCFDKMIKNLGLLLDNGNVNGKANFLNKLA